MQDEKHKKFERLLLRVKQKGCLQQEVEAFILL